MNKSTVFMASFAIFALVIVGVQPLNAEPKSYDYLIDRDDDYPGCVTIVKQQLMLIPEAQRDSILPFLLDACMAGRSIGEKRMLNMYEIPKNAQPKKKTGFTIELVPPRPFGSDPFYFQS